MQFTFVRLGTYTFHLATDRRSEVLKARHTLLRVMWEYIDVYQRRIEKKLGLKE